jgi:uncharacterized membrane protein
MLLSKIFKSKSLLKIMKSISIYKLVFLFVFIINFQNCFSFNTYYANLEIDISENGLVEIDGITNFEKFKNLQTQNFTSKKKEFWILNISTQEMFEDYIFTLNLPKGTKINYIKTTKKLRIEDNEDKISLIGTGENQKLNILVQYKIQNEKTNQNYIFWVVLGFVFIIGFYLSYFLKFSNRKNNLRNKNKNLNDLNKEVKSIDYSKLKLNERQKQIINIIKTRKETTQKQIIEIMKIPKSSVSRNVQSLISKGIIKSRKTGISIYLSLKD